MKKICFVTTVSMTLKVFVLDTAKYLYEKENYEITFICNTDEDFGKMLPSYITYIPIPMKRGISFAGVKAIIRMFYLFKKEKYDLVQYSTPNASLYASIAAKLSGTPVRLYCQWGIIYTGFFGIKRRLFKLIEKLVCALSTWVEPDSYGNLKFSTSEGLYTKNKSSVVWNGSASGVNLKKFDIKNKKKWRSEVRNKFNIDENSFLIGFVGRITRDKGINEFLKACKAFLELDGNTRILIIGNIEKKDTLDQELYNWSYNENRIIYAGLTSEIEKYYAAMDIFILPSYREGFGSVVIEAEAMGVPVIVTNIPGPTDAMKENKTGLLIKKGDVKSLVNAIVKLHQDENLTRLMSEEAYKFASSKFDSELLKQFILEDRNRLLRGQKL